MRAILISFTALAMAISSPGMAEDAPAKTVLVNEEFGVPVFPYDLTDRPYKVLGEVKASVRKATIFSKAPSQEKIYRELWERGQKLGADAVVKAEYGDPKITALSWGASAAKGVAIKFLDPTPADSHGVASASPGDASAQSSIPADNAGSEAGLPVE